MRSLSSGCSPAWPCAAGLPARVGAADCAIVKSMHRSSSWEARNPGSCENPSWPQLAAPSGDAKAAPSIESEGVYAGARLCPDQSLFMAVHLRPEPRALVQKSSIEGSSGWSRKVWGGADRQVARCGKFTPTFSNFQHYTGTRTHSTSASTSTVIGKPCTGYDGMSIIPIPRQEPVNPATAPLQSNRPSMQGSPFQDT